MERDYNEQQSAGAGQGTGAETFNDDVSDAAAGESRNAAAAERLGAGKQ